MKHELRPTVKHGMRVGSAVSAIMLLTSGVAGCHSQYNARGTSGTSITPPTDAYAFSGGKITRFTPMPGLPSDPSDKMLLTAFKLSRLSGSTARSGAVSFQSSTGNNLVSCLVVNNNVLVVLEDFIRQAFGWLQSDEAPGSTIIVRGVPYNNKPFVERRQGEIFLYQDSLQYVQVTPGIPTALVGGKIISLHHPIIWQDGKHPLSGDHVILLSDLLKLWQEHDKQVGHGVSIRNVKIIYNLQDYRR